MTRCTRLFLVSMLWACLNGWACGGDAKKNDDKTSTKEDANAKVCPSAEFTIVANGNSIPWYFFPDLPNKFDARLEDYGDSAGDDFFYLHFQGSLSGDANDPDVSLPSVDVILVGFLNQAPVAQLGENALALEDRTHDIWSPVTLEFTVQNPTSLYGSYSSYEVERAEGSVTFTTLNAKPGGKIAGELNALLVDPASDEESILSGHFCGLLPRH